MEVQIQFMKNNQKFKYEKARKRKQNSNQNVVKHTQTTAHVKKEKKKLLASIT